MATVADLDRYVASVRGLYIDVDRMFGAQCWDQWSHYAANFLGVPVGRTYSAAGGYAPHGGWACNVYHNARAAGLEQWFEILPASAAPRPGDVAFWEFGSAWYPGSHVATVLGVTHGGRMLRCLTQNPGAVQIADLIVNGLIGYLRPRALILTGGSTPTRKVDDMLFQDSKGIMFVADEFGMDKIGNIAGSADNGENVSAARSLFNGGAVEPQINDRQRDVIDTMSSKRWARIRAQIVTDVIAKIPKASVDTAAIVTAVTDAVVKQGVKVDATAIAKAVEDTLKDDFEAIPAQTTAALGKKLS